jgi:hypothetical protein
MNLTRGVFIMGGVDASGFQWTQQIPVTLEPVRQVVTITQGEVYNYASGETVYAPGMLVTVEGSDLAANTAAGTTLPLPATLPRRRRAAAFSLSWAARATDSLRDARRHAGRGWL